MAKFQFMNENKCSKPCILCDSENIDVLSLVGRDREYLRTVICKECGLIWTDPVPIEVKKYYERDYRIQYKGSYTPKLKHVYRAAKVAINRYKKIEKYLSNKNSILDIGSGGGEFLYLLNKLGFYTTGIEPNRSYGEYASRTYGLNIYIGFAQNIVLEKDTFDVITMWQVLEHIDNPLFVLQKVYNWLKDSGILVIEVPNVEAVCQAPKNRFHVAHLYNFNEKNLSLLCRKTGFTLIYKSISKDGGNLLQIFEKVSVNGTEVSDVDFTDYKIPGKYRDIREIIITHTDFTHYTSLYPYVRFLKKIPRILIEWRISKKFNSGKEILDYYFENIY